MPLLCLRLERLMKAWTPFACIWARQQQCFPSLNRFFIQQFVTIMEAYQSEFCEDEFYNILETISPFATSVNEVEFCPRCKSAPCTCMKVTGFKMTTGINNNKKRYHYFNLQICLSFHVWVCLCSPASSFIIFIVQGATSDYC